ncbi:2-oxoglutarate-dependent dioxygenase DAO [Camellia lanceoleosa]|uniref:2-oxoglutarate-dependent dioxygenase DAO n=1 Tax=Camellia lanceoleosa TaxID=1840588 RepID=A0ACC0IYH1_9ERIC|nr:2-oxoglutarate-dependent dioxygenase DAO [Camellia lanceoleosa]
MATNNQCNVAVIDLEDFPGQSRKMIQACEELGCFRITNHHQFLPPTLSLEMKAVIRSLFDLPVEIKRRNTDVIPGSGYMAPSQINPHYEAFGLYDIASHEAVNDFFFVLS